MTLLVLDVRLPEEDANELLQAQAYSRTPKILGQVPFEQEVAPSAMAADESQNLFSSFA